LSHLTNCNFIVRMFVVLWLAIIHFIHHLSYYLAFVYNTFEIFDITTYVHTESPTINLFQIKHIDIFETIFN